MGSRLIVAIEDDPDILEVIAYNLRREGFRVEGVRDGEEGLACVCRENPDLVLLDLMLPGLDGLEVCRRMKADPLTSRVPVIMVTAKGEETDVVLGLGLGADDYVTKPFGPKELVARVQAVLRRGPDRSDAPAGRVVRGALAIDPERFEARVNGEPVALTPTEFRLVHFLASHPGRVFTRDHLLSRVVGEHAVVVDRNIDVHVHSARRKLGAPAEAIETIRGVGYRFRDDGE